MARRSVRGPIRAAAHLGKLGWLGRVGCRGGLARAAGGASGALLRRGRGDDQRARLPLRPRLPRARAYVAEASCLTDHCSKTWPAGPPSRGSSALDHASGCPKLTPQAPHPVSAKQPLLGRAGRPHILSNRESGLFYTGRSARAQRVRLQSGMSFCCGVTSCEKQRSFDHMRPLPARPVGRGWPGGDSRGLPWALASAGPVCSDSSSRSPFWAMFPTYSYNIHPTCT